MAKDFVGSLGGAELNALMAMQLQKMNAAVIKLNKLFEDNDVKDVNTAYQKETMPESFIRSRDAALKELSDVIETMDKIRTAQNSLGKKGE